MTITPTPLQGCYVLQPRVFEDQRGYFFESFHQKAFEEAIGEPVRFVQDNQSFSMYGVIRGLHAQVGIHEQAKLVRVLAGEIFDVAVDFRKDSHTYGKHFGIRLSAENKQQLFIPRGFLHGFSVLSDTAVVLYKCDQFYDRDSETGVRFDDAFLNIDWQIPQSKQIVSEKDLLLRNWEFD